MHTTMISRAWEAILAEHPLKVHKLEPDHASANYFPYVMYYRFQSLYYLWLLKPLLGVCPSLYQLCLDLYVFASHKLRLLKFLQYSLTYIGNSSIKLRCRYCVLYLYEVLIKLFPYRLPSTKQVNRDDLVELDTIQSRLRPPEVHTLYIQFNVTRPLVLIRMGDNDMHTTR